MDPISAFAFNGFSRQARGQRLVGKRRMGDCALITIHPTYGHTHSFRRLAIAAASQLSPGMRAMSSAVHC